MTASNDPEGEQNNKVPIPSAEFHGRFMTELTPPIVNNVVRHDALRVVEVHRDPKRQFYL